MRLFWVHRRCFVISIGFVCSLTLSPIDTSISRVAIRAAPHLGLVTWPQSRGPSQAGPCGVEQGASPSNPGVRLREPLLTYPEGRLKVSQQLTNEGVSHGDLSKYAAGAIFKCGWL